MTVTWVCMYCWVYLITITLIMCITGIAGITGITGIRTRTNGASSTGENCHGDWPGNTRIMTEEIMTEEITGTGAVKCYRPVTDPVVIIMAGSILLLHFPGYLLFY